MYPRLMRIRRGGLLWGKPGEVRHYVILIDETRLIVLDIPDVTNTQSITLRAEIEDCMTPKDICERIA